MYICTFCSCMYIFLNVHTCIRTFLLCIVSTVNLYMHVAACCTYCSQQQLHSPTGVWWSLGRCPRPGRWVTVTVNSCVSPDQVSSAGKTSVNVPQASRWTPLPGNARVCIHWELHICSSRFLCEVMQTDVMLFWFQWRIPLQWCRCWRWFGDSHWHPAIMMRWFPSEGQVQDWVHGRLD